MSEPVAERAGVVPPWTLGWRLQRALAWAKMTTEQMAYELGVARSTVSRWCNDKGHPTRGYLKLWALRTGVPVDWLIHGDGLPRVDSNHQPAGWWSDLGVVPPPVRGGHVPVRGDQALSDREVIALQKRFRTTIRRGSLGQLAEHRSAELPVNDPR